MHHRYNSQPYPTSPIKSLQVTLSEEMTENRREQEQKYGWPLPPKIQGIQTA